MIYLNMKMFTVLKPVLYIGFLLGLVPYSLHKRSLFIPASLYSLALIFLVWQSYAKMLSMSFNETVTSLYAYGYLLPLQMSFNSLVTFTSWIVVLYRHHMWLEIFEELKYVETSIKLFETDTSYKAPLVIQTVGLFFLFVIIFVYYLSFYLKMWELSWVVVCGQSVATAVNFTLLIEFLAYITIVKANFSTINQELAHLMDYKTQTFGIRDLLWVPYKGHKVPLFVGSARGIHSHLCSLCRHINKSFGCQLLVSVSKEIVSITLILYTISLTFIGKAETSNQNMAVYLAVIGSVLVHNTSELLLLVFICSSVSDQANYTAVLVHKLMNKDLPSGTREELQLFSYQLLHQKVFFSVCGFFNLDFTLLNGVIASVATYLVILIQFQM